MCKTQNVLSPLLDCIYLQVKRLGKFVCVEVLRPSQQPVSSTLTLFPGRLRLTKQLTST